MMKSNKPFKPTEVSPALKPLIILFWIVTLPLFLLGMLTNSSWLAAIGIATPLGITIIFLPFLYPKIIVSEEGFHIQRKRNDELQTLPWSQFQCMYSFRQGMTYKECGILFTTRPMSKQEQFEAAKSCQEGGIHPHLTHDGHLWVGTSMAALQSLHSIIPNHIQQMPETACANVNLLFTKLI